MLLEERHARLSVDLLLVVLDDSRDPVCEHQLLALSDGVFEQLLVPVETELVHRIDLVQVIEDEVEDGGLSAAVSEDFTSVINFLEDDLGLLKSLLNLIGLLLGFLKGVNEGHILK